MRKLHLRGMLLVLCGVFMFHSGCATDVEHGNVAFDVSRDGKQLVFSSAAGDLFLLDLSTQKVTQLTRTTNVESTPAFSPDGKSVVFATELEGKPGSKIFSISTDGTNRVQLTHDEGVNDSRPRFSADGTHIAFARAHLDRPYSLGGRTWDDWDIYLMNNEGSNLIRLTQNKYYGVGGLTLSPDGISVYFSAENDRAADDSSTTVFKVAVDGKQAVQPGVPQPVAKTGAVSWASEPAVSPDGQNLVFTSDRGKPFEYDLVVLNIATGKTTSAGVTKVSRYNQNPVFTNDGSKILFLAATSWNSGSRPIFSLWSIDADGTNAKEISTSQLFTEPMKWAPKKQP